MKRKVTKVRRLAKLTASGKRVIGRKDKVDFPDLGLRNIEVKVDTGAFTSSIHCSEIEPFRRRGRLRVRFRILGPGLSPRRHFVLPAKERRTVRSSFGDRQERFVIETSVKMFGETFNIELALADRTDMNFPVLLGRKFLRSRFIVDVTRYDISYREKKKRKRKE